MIPHTDAKPMPKSSLPKPTMISAKSPSEKKAQEPFRFPEEDREDICHGARSAYQASDYSDNEKGRSCGKKRGICYFDHPDTGYVIDPEDEKMKLADEFVKTAVHVAVLARRYVMDLPYGTGIHG